VTKEEIMALPIGAALTISGTVAMEYGNGHPRDTRMARVCHRSARSYVYFIGYKWLCEGRRTGGDWEDSASFRVTRKVFAVEVRIGPSRRTKTCLPEQAEIVVVDDGRKP
jgi:hypothetical protein